MALSFDSLTAAQIAAGVAAGDFTATEVAQASLAAKIPVMFGVLTTFVEWDSIRSTTGKKVLYMFTFPVFMMTYIPIALVALVKKCNWKPIKHSISVDVAELSDAASAAPQKQRERTM